MFCEGFFSFFFTPNALVHSELRRVGEAVKAINKNLLMGGRVRDRTHTRVVREGARLLGREMEKWGGMRKKVGEG